MVVTLLCSRLLVKCHPLAPCFLLLYNGSFLPLGTVIGATGMGGVTSSMKATQSN
jgi:hypothetical protein